MRKRNLTVGINLVPIRMTAPLSSIVRVRDKSTPLPRTHPLELLRAKYTISTASGAGLGGGALGTYADTGLRARVSIS